MNYLPSMSQYEFAFSSLNKHSKLLELTSNQNDRFHISQKPIKLYQWILKNYAKPNDIILDTHLGSGSNAIACHYYGCSLVAAELDEEYYKASLKRFKQQTAQIKLF